MATTQRAAFKITLEAFKKGFVDTETFIEVVGAKRRAYLQAGGELVRRLTDRTLKKAKRSTVSASARRERNWPPRKKIYEKNPPPRFPAIRIKRASGNLRDISKPLFMLDDPKFPNKVTIGPPRLVSNPVPKILEQGGRSQTETRRRERRINQPGEIRVDSGRVARSGKRSLKRVAKDSRSTARVWSDTAGFVNVTYAKLRTPNQVRRANEINQSLYAPSKPISVAPRRYMRQILRMATALPTNRNEWMRKQRALFNGYKQSIKGLEIPVRLRA